MPQVELAAVARLVLVAFDNIGLDADRGGNSVRKQVGIGARAASKETFSIRVKRSASAMTAALTTSASPVRNSRSESVRSISGIARSRSAAV